MERPSTWPVVYSRAEVPDALVELDELELVVSWEISNAELSREGMHTVGISDLDDLFRRKAAAVIEEKGAECLRVRHEHITRKINHAHNSTVVHGVFRVILYGEQKGQDAEAGR